jgi:hypothetical protein
MSYYNKLQSIEQSVVYLRNITVEFHNVLKKHTLGRATTLRPEHISIVGISAAFIHVNFINSRVLAVCLLVVCAMC